MAWGFSTKGVKDASRETFLQRVINESGAAEGPFQPVFQGAINVKASTAIITSGQSLSGAVDCGFQRLAGINMPAGWTSAAPLTFSVSSDGTNYHNLYDVSGAEYQVEADAGRAIVMPVSDFFGWQFIKIRSGPSALGVNQGSDRILELLLA